MLENRTIIMKTIYGAHLFGTQTENSDYDFKGVFLPSKEEILLGNIPKSLKETTKKIEHAKNEPGDIETEFYSLHYFIQLACLGETVALDMLYSPFAINIHPIWNKIVENRHLFHTKNLKAFIEFARTQASKYGVKGERINAVKKVIDCILKHEKHLTLTNHRIKEIWDDLPIGEFIIKHETPNENGEKMYEVCNRKLGEKASIQYLLDMVVRIHEQYGHRAQMAANNEGIDWKAISHAFRASYEVKQILENGNIIFPLENADFLKDIKLGKVQYVNEISPKLDILVSEIDEMCKNSNLPERVDIDFWNKFIIDSLEEYVMK